MEEVQLYLINNEMVLFLVSLNRYGRLRDRLGFLI
jgi:hypothetical protein